MKHHLSLRPRVETLEDRLAPATLSNPWPTNQLTLSFVPDGTLVGGVASELYSKLDAQLDRGVWQNEILRAFQTWAASANLNISLVADNGAALGSAGPLFGASGFGDIRIAAVPGGTWLASTNPFAPAVGTWAGDIMLNSTVAFGSDPGEHDLFSVALHEAGRALGMAESLDPTSAMFTYYTPRTGLSDADLTSLRDFYGARTADALEGTRGNDTQGRATDFNAAALVQYIAQFLDNSAAPTLPQLTVAADLTTTGDVDYFTYQSAANDPGFTIQLHTSGISLLGAKVTVYDSKGKVLATKTDANPFDGDLTLRVAGVRGKDEYFIKVEGASADVFGIGGYRLQIVPDSARPLVPFKVVDALAGLLPEPNNHSFGNATNLGREFAATNDRFDHATIGQLARASEVDYYRLRAPSPGAGQSQVMTLMTWGGTPTIKVYDAARNLVSAEVVAAGNGSYVIDVAGAAAGATYYVSVTGATGEYFLGVDFSIADTPVTELFASGTLGVVESPPEELSFAAQSLMAMMFSVVVPVNPPSLEEIPDQTVAVGATLSLTAVGSDLDPGDTLTYSLVGDTYGAAIDPTTGQFSWTPTAADTYTFTVRVADNGDLTATRTFTVIVTDVPPAPTVVMQDFRSVVLSQNTLFHLEFGFQTPTATVETAMQVTLFNMNGDALGTWFVRNGERVSANIFLQAGSYTFRFVGGTIDGSPLAASSYQISGYALNDPIGPALVPPTTPPPPPPPPYQWLATALIRILATVDPYGRPITP